MHLRALETIVIFVSACLLGCGDEKPSLPSADRRAETPGTYANVKQLEVFTNEACKCKSAACAAKVRRRAEAFLSERERGAMYGNEKFEKCLAAASLDAASKEAPVSGVSTEAALLELTSIVDVLCNCENLACSQDADLKLSRAVEGMKHINISELSDAHKESLDKIGARAKSCRAEHQEPGASVHEPGAEPLEPGTPAKSAQADPLAPGTPAMGVEHAKVYADAMCAATDRASLAAVRTKFAGSQKRFSHLRREDYGALWEEGAKHSKRANECRMAIENKSRQSP